MGARCGRGNGSDRAKMVLAAACVGGFWLLPFSPLAAVGALWATQGTEGRSRKLAVAGAVLCTIYTLLMAIVVARLAWEVGPSGLLVGGF